MSEFLDLQNLQRKESLLDIVAAKNVLENEASISGKSMLKNLQKAIQALFSDGETDRLLFVSKDPKVKTSYFVGIDTEKMVIELNEIKTKQKKVYRLNFKTGEATMNTQKVSMDPFYKWFNKALSDQKEKKADSFVGKKKKEAI